MQLEKMKIFIFSKGVDFVNTLCSLQRGAFLSPFFKISPNKYKPMFAFNAPGIPGLSGGETPNAKLQEIKRRLHHNFRIWKND